MKDKEIIDIFFSNGCLAPDGNKIPLRNCNKIKKLFERDLQSASCCESLQREVYETYKERMKIFLKIEKHSSSKKNPGSDRAHSDLKKNC
tara:strand:- start:97 stop:366 length:270 start_codon:yes stop_codon:yes gene_type:complete